MIFIIERLHDYVTHLMNSKNNSYNKNSFVLDQKQSYLLQDVLT